MPRAAARAQEHELLAPPFLEPPTRFLQDLCGSPAAIARLLQRARAVGEPWMSGWSKTAFASLLEASAFRVAEDLTVGDLEDEKRGSASSRRSVCEVDSARLLI